MKHLSLLLLLPTCLALHNLGYSQLNPSELLQKAGIGLDQESLVRALLDARPAIRSQAAGVLGEKKDIDALPALEKALEGESSLNVRFAMLTAAQALGSSKAEAGLASLCSVDDITLKLGAAIYLQSLGDDVCGHRRYSRAVSIIVMYSATLQAAAPKELTPGPVIEVSTSGDRHLLDQLVQIARENQLPLGVLLTDQTPCKKDVLSFEEMGQPITVGALAKELERKVPEYRLQVQNGALVFKPENSRGPAQELLALNIDDFRPISTTMSGTNQYLWMYINAAIDPGRGSMGVITSSLDEPRLSSFRLMQPLKRF